MQADTILNYIKNKFTTNEGVSAGSSDEFQISVHRKDFQNFIRDQDMKFCCTFQNRSSLNRGRRSQNASYLEDGPTAEDIARSERNNTRDANGRLPKKTQRKAFCAFQ
jgi:hypothetical protein